MLCGFNEESDHDLNPDDSTTNDPGKQSETQP